MKGKKCFGVLLALSIIFGVFLNGYSDVSALTKDFNLFLVHYATSSTAPYEVSNWLPYSSSSSLSNHTPSFFKFDRVASSVSNITVPSGNNNLVFTEKWNFVTYCLVNNGGDYYGRCPEISSSNQFLRSVSINGTLKEFISDNVDVFVTDWPCPSPTVSGAYLPCRTFTFQVSAVVRDVSGNINTFNVNAEFSGSVALPVNSTTTGYFESSDSNRAVFDFLDASGTITNDLLLQQLQNQKLELQALQNLNTTLNNQANQDQEDRDNLENASDDAESGANSAQSQAQTAGTTLLKAFSDFVGAITNASASDCIIDADMGNLDLGEIDLCQLSLPQPFQVLASLTVIGFCVPLSIATAKKLIALIRSFQ